MTELHVHVVIQGMHLHCCCSSIRWPQAASGVMRDLVGQQQHWSPLFMHVHALHFCKGILSALS
jgi:hypothetical protein